MFYYKKGFMKKNKIRASNNIKIGIGHNGDVFYITQLHKYAISDTIHGVMTQNSTFLNFCFAVLPPPNKLELTLAGKSKEEQLKKRRYLHFE